MRVLVTGATGFVGSSVVRAVHDAGHEVIGLVRDPARAAGLAGSGVDLRRGDMTAPSTYAPLVDEVDAVVHAAQLGVGSPLTGSRVRRLYAADALMTSTLADACLRAGRRLVYTGGCFDWGDHGDAEIDETTPLTPSPMGVGHARQADYLDRRHREDGLDVVRLSPGFVYGPGGLYASAFLEQAQRNRLRCIGDGANWWSCVHVDDLARAYVLALEAAPAGRAYAVVDDNPVRLRELTDLTTDALGRPRVGSVPPWLIGLLIGRTLVDSLTTSFRITGTRIRTELGWTPRTPSIHDGVHHVAAAWTSR